MRVLADFLLESDLCLADGAEPVVISNAEENFELSLSNVELGSRAEVAQLACRVLFDADGIDVVAEVASEKLAKAVSALVYATNRKFALKRLLKVVEWTPGLKEREAIIFHESPLDDRAEPGLVTEFGKSADRLMAMQSKPQQSSAMRWYRLGIGSAILDEQFAYFWFALEVAAQTLKSTDKVPSNCPRCRGKLFCESCKEHPTHRPYPAEAIRQAVERVNPNNADEVFETLQKIRHTLMHGDRIDSIASELPCTAEQATNKLAQIAWNAIGLMFDRADPNPEKPIHFGFVDSVVRKNLIAGARIKIGFPGDPNNPRIEDFPDISLTLDYVRRSPTVPPPAR